MNAPPDPARLRTQILARIRAGDSGTLPDEEFNRLALAVFGHQFRENAPYRAYCERRGVTPQGVGHWSEVPAVPTDAFKAAPLVCGGAEAATVVFRTSGTTAGSARRGEHYVPDLTLYDAALRAGFAAHLLPEGGRMRMLSLIPSPAEVPDSSLSHMIGEVVEEFGAEGSGYYLRDGALRREAMVPALREAEASGAPVCLLGTSFAFVHLLDALRDGGERIALPEGSRIMDTGGFKGRSREVSREELYGEFHERLGVPGEWCVNEYGMTEMGSQFYDGVAGRSGPRLYHPPPWVRTQVVDPETLRPLAVGGVGVLRHWDLVNLGSVMALQTADLGELHPEGGFRVLGRARGAEARGCSLATEELLEALEKK